MPRRPTRVAGERQERGWSNGYDGIVAPMMLRGPMTARASATEADMDRTSREEWAKRVERWRDSGLTAAEFTAELAQATAIAKRTTGVPTRTTRRWQRWWRGPFVATPVFVEITRRLVPGHTHPTDTEFFSVQRRRL
jgi:hypothetical protein